MVLLDRRYEEIKNNVAMLYTKYNVQNYPIDVFKLCKDMNITVIPYSDLSPKEQIAAYTASQDGFFSEIEDVNSAYLVIFYNDTMMNERIRFTILHEIGHIVLGHKEHSDVAEAEANFFAKYAIAPPPIVDTIHPEDFYDIMHAFGLSNECACNSMNYYTKWLKYHKNDNQDYEVILVNLFTHNTLRKE